MDACTNEEQQVPEDQQTTNPQWNTQRNKNKYIWQEKISIFCLITCPHCQHMTHWKHSLMTHLIQLQGKIQTSTCHTTL